MATTATSRTMWEPTTGEENLDPTSHMPTPPASFGNFTLYFTAHSDISDHPYSSLTKKSVQHCDLRAISDFCALAIIFVCLFWLYRAVE